jgi:hypothetical protein
MNHDCSRKLTASLIIIALAFFNVSCIIPVALNTSIPTLPTRDFKTPPQKIVVANAYDVKAASVRDNKEKLFSELINLTVRHTSNEINRRSEIPATFVEGIAVPITQPDSSIQKLMTAHLASHAIIVKSFNASFEQTEVNVTEADDGSKNRQAMYDIIVDIGYTFHNWSGRQFDTLISARRFHSSRNVLSGFLAAGPNIVANSEDAADGIYANVDMYLKSFFKGTENRTRIINITKEFKEVNRLIQAGEHDKAFQVCESLRSSDKIDVASRASYCCAVLLEYMGRYNEVKFYLEESLRGYYSPDAEMMLKDYRLYRVQQ